jgi:mercuric ion transport protein
MLGKNLLRFGITGTVVTALCCFTPVLVVLFSALGISALTGMLDLVLLPALAIFVGITGFALWKQKEAKPN